MFTGLIEEVGAVLAMETTDRGTRLQIAAPHVAETTHSGDSIAVNGCCLTVAEHRGAELTFDLLEESLERTNLRSLGRESRVNLERALPANGRLGGHFVQGHVDGVGTVTAVEPEGEGVRLTIDSDEDVCRYCIEKGSIAVDGVSLTIAALADGGFEIALVPHTLEQTTLSMLRPGDQVNLEVDVLGKYVERLLGDTMGR